MEFILEMKNNVWGGKPEKFIAILMAIVLACGLFVNGYNQIQRKMQLTAAEKEIVVSEKEEVVDTKVEKLKIVESVKSIEKDILDDNTVEDSKTVLEAEATVKPEIAAKVETTEKSESAVKPEETVKSEIAEKPEEIVNSEISMEFGENIESDLVAEPEEAAKSELSIESEETIKSETGATDNIVETNSPFLIDEAGMIYGFLPEYADLTSGFLKLPSEGCVGIRKGTFAGCSEYIAEVCIPAEITEIEDGALTELVSLEWITVEAGNTKYKSMDGILFDSTGTTLYAYPPARVGAYSIPAGVTNIAENAFQNTSLFIIDLRECGLTENCLLNISESCSIIR